MDTAPKQQVQRAFIEIEKWTKLRSEPVIKPNVSFLFSLECGSIFLSVAFRFDLICGSLVSFRRLFDTTLSAHKFYSSPLAK